METAIGSLMDYKPTTFTFTFAYSGITVVFFNHSLFKATIHNLYYNQSLKAIVDKVTHQMVDLLPRK